MKRNYLSCPHMIPEIVESALKMMKSHSLQTFQCASCDYSSWSLSQWKQHFLDTNHVLCVRKGQNPELYCSKCFDYQFCSVFDHLSGRKRSRFDHDRSDHDNDIECKINTKSDTITTHRRFPVPGLINMGATCFMNSVLQVLSSSFEFRSSKEINNHFNQCSFGRNRIDNDTITSTETRSSVEVSNNSTTACIPCEFKRIADTLSGETDDEPVVIPSHLLYAMWSFVDYLAGYTQQDAHEFLIAFLNSMDCQIRATVSPYAENEDFTALFTGSVQSKLICTVCGDASVTTEKFVDLSLNLDHHSKVPYSQSAPNMATADAESLGQELTLSDCLEHFTSTEQLLDKVGCSSCRVEQFRTKGLKLGDTPDLLILHFKRFDFFRQRKLSKKVHFPLRDLSLEQFQATDHHNEKMYHLIGVVSHFGTLHQGHYISYIHDVDNDTWMKCDDDNVTEVTPKEVLEAEAYLLFYQADKPQVQP